MTGQANAKINLGLYVTEKRPDGYHNLETVFIPVPLCDTLEIRKAPAFAFHQEGIAINCAPEDNLCVKAFRLLQKDFPDIGDIAIRLHKRIPFGAGLGGGSADAAETLKLLNNLFELDLHIPQLHYYASLLGSDCAFFIENVPAFATGRGEALQALPRLDFHACDLLLLKPDDSVSTAEAYRGVTPRPAPVDLREAVLQPMEEWKNLISNQFEESVFPAHPHIRACKEWLYAHGARYASMSGSGSCVYGFFPKGEKPILPENKNITAYRLAL